jgi:hypothetical protein
MTEAERKVRAYLAKIGRRGGITSRRELTKSHARKMGCYPRSEARSVESGKNLATARSQTNKTFIGRTNRS